MRKKLKSVALFFVSLISLVIRNNNAFASNHKQTKYIIT